MAKILIVDDSFTLRSSLTFTLKNDGHTVDEAENGVLAMQKFKTGSDYELVVTDINMPEMDGLELLANIRKVNRTIPVLVLTTESDKDKIEKAKLLKANGWIIKPFKNDDLTLVVNKLLNP